MNRRLAMISLAALAVGAAVFVGLAALPSHRVPLVDPHGARVSSKLAPGKLARILRATQAVSASVSSDDLAAEGKRLFQSTALARTGESCESCHPNGGTNAAVGTIIHPRRPGDFTGPRAPLPLWGVGRTAPYLWTGSVATLEEQAVRVVLDFFAAGAAQPIDVTTRQASALTAYMKTITAPVSSFDTGTMSAAALRGQQIFQGKGGCVICHGGPLFTDNNLHNILVPQVSGADDPGSTVVAGAFNTPTLRNVRNSAPYMHNGVFKDLADVVSFYDDQASIAPLHMTRDEKADLVAFLESL